MENGTTRTVLGEAWYMGQQALWCNNEMQHDGHGEVQDEAALVGATI